MASEFSTDTLAKRLRRCHRTDDAEKTQSLTVPTFTYDADPDQQLIVNTAEPGSPSEQALRILASSAVNEQEPARSLTD